MLAADHWIWPTNGPPTSAEEARAAAARVAEQVTAARLGAGAISVSFGVACTTDRHSDALLEAADQELLAAKDRHNQRRIPPART